MAGPQKESILTSNNFHHGSSSQRRQKGPLHKFRAMSETQNFPRDGKLGANDDGLGSIESAYFTAV